MFVSYKLLIPQYLTELVLYCILIAAEQIDHPCLVAVVVETVACVTTINTVSYFLVTLLPDTLHK